MPRSRRISMVVAPGAILRPEDPAVARSLLAAHFARRGPLAVAAAAARWRFELRGVERYLESKYVFSVAPADGFTGVDDRGRRFAEYRAPRAALPPGAEPDVPGAVFRGMSWEEWRGLRRSCEVRSAGTHNIFQEGLTFFGGWATAVEYASAYAPLAFRPAADLPGVVVAVPERLVLSSRDLPSLIPPGEWAARGALPAAAVVGAWYVVPTYVREGSIELLADHRGRLLDDYGSSPSQRYAVVPGDATRALRGCRR